MIGWWECITRSLAAAGAAAMGRRRGAADAAGAIRAELRYSCADLPLVWREGGKAQPHPDSHDRMWSAINRGWKRAVAIEGGEPAW